MLSPKIVEKWVIYCLGNTQRFLEGAGGENRRGEVCPKTANESRISSVCCGYEFQFPGASFEGSF